MRRLRCAVVGLGRIGSLLEADRLREKPCTHAGAIRSSRDCMLIGGADTDPERRDAFGKRWRCPTFDSLDSMLAAARPDILHVATPPDSHLDLVRAAVGAGVAVVVCEKPLAENLEEAEEIAALHRSGRARILTNHERRYSRDYLRARARLQEGTYGSLLSAAARLYLGRSRAAGEILLHDGTHLADILSYLLGGRLELRRADLHRVEDREIIMIAADCRGVPVHIECGAGRDHLVFELDLSLVSGRIRIGNGLYEEYASHPSPYYAGTRSLRRLPIRRPRRTGYFSGMMADAVRCARDPRWEPVSSALDGLEALGFVLTACGEPGPSAREN